MHKSFSPALIDGIPAELLRVLDDIQELVGVVVEAKPHSEEFIFEMPVMSLASAVLDIDLPRSSITIWYQPDEIIPPSIAHELIHLRRYIVENVPKLFATTQNSDISQEIDMLENELEHLMVVPEQISLFPESEQWWVDQYSSLLSRVDRNSTALMFAWSFLRNVLPHQKELSDRCWQLVNKYDVVGPADNIRHHMKLMKPQKLQMIERMLEGWPALRDFSILARYKASNGRLVVEPL